MTKCLPLCGKRKKNRKVLERKEIVRKKETRKIEKEKVISWMAVKGTKESLCCNKQK